MEEEKRYRSVTYRLYPNATQTKALEASLEHCRLLYNELLSRSRELLATEGRKLDRFGMMKLGTLVFKSVPGRSDAYSTCRQNVAVRVHRAMSGCRIGVTGRLIHVPRFRSANRYDSFCYESDQGFEFKGDRLHLSEIGDVRYRNPYHPKGKMVMCTVKRDARGKWHAVIVYSVEPIMRNEENLEDPSFPEGYDLGLGNLVTDTSGKTVEVQDFYAEEKETIAKLQRRIAEHERGSPAWERCRRRLAVIHMDIHRRRRGFLHRLAHDMVEGHTKVVLEDLEVKRMKEKADNSAAVRDRYTEASWATLVGMVGCKAAEAGIPLILVDPAFTSRTCSGCGNVKLDLPLSERTYRCGCCGLVMDRDRNAAINILTKGLGVETFRPAENGQPC